MMSVEIAKKILSSNKLGYSFKIIVNGNSMAPFLKNE